ncbi:MAG TPA: metalloregulator ArsR/SmtB family transcription factor [Thermomicrobiales bacterium]|jgi:ArsR family transcriptional regulator|nr:metalloregulator ArsR/SmtB family transcription factor [Thermomicrobiales bacterium]
MDQEIRPVVTDPVEDARLLVALKALADASRLAILQLIAAQDEPICACHIVDRFDLRQPTISHHLKVLSEAGLITTERHGVWAYYAIDPRGLGGVVSSMVGLAGRGD